MWKNATNVIERFWLWGIDTEVKTAIHVFMFEENLSVLGILRDTQDYTENWVKL